MVDSTEEFEKLAERYQIISRLGEGGFGQTFLAKDEYLPGHPQCVVKRLKPRSHNSESLKTARRLFETEAKVLYDLGNHDRIPHLLAHFEQGGEFYLVQEFIDGLDLSHQFSNTKLTESEVISLLKDILEILEFVHAKGVIHRDIKPSNLIQRRQDGKIVLIDFGAVKQVMTSVETEQVQPSQTIAIGSLGYMPKEQLAGFPRFCSDIYAAGMVSIQLLTQWQPAQFPEDLQTGEIIWRDRANVSPAFADLLEKMVRSDFRQRYQTVTEVLQEVELLGHYLSDPTIPLTDPQEQLTQPPYPSLSDTQPAEFSLFEPRTVGWDFWFQWVQITAIGGLVGGLVGGAIGWGYPFRQEYRLLGWAVGYCLGGIVIGLSQWLMLKKQLAQPSRWASISTISLSTGFAIALAIASLSDNEVGGWMIGLIGGCFVSWFIDRAVKNLEPILDHYLALLQQYRLVYRFGGWGLLALVFVIIISLVRFKVPVILAGIYGAVYGAIYGSLTGGLAIKLLQRSPKISS